MSETELFTILISVASALAVLLRAFAKVKDANAAITEAQAKVDEIDAQTRAFVLKTAQANDDKVDALEVRLAKAVDSLEQSMRREERSSERILQLQRELNDAKDTIKKLSDTVNEMELMRRRIGDLEQQIERLRITEQVLQARVALYEQQITNLQQKLEQSQVTVDALNDRILLLKADVAAYEELIDNLKRNGVKIDAAGS